MGSIAEPRAELISERCNKCHRDLSVLCAKLLPTELLAQLARLPISAGCRREAADQSARTRDTPSILLAVAHVDCGFSI